MDTPLVSVVVPAYNYGRYLAAALESALAQDWPRDALEIVVVDDGSTDDTAELVARYASAGVRYVWQPNGGVNSATSRGMEEGRGEFLTFLDADDTWPGDRVSRLAEVLIERPDVGLVYGDMEVVDDAGAVIAPSFRALYGVQAHEGRVLGRLMAHNFISGGATMVRTSLRNCYYPIGPESAWQDWWIPVRVAPFTNVAAIPAIVNRYRSHGENLNLGSDGERLARLMSREIPFRRFMLATVGHGTVTVAELRAAVGAFNDTLERIAARGGPDRAELLPVSAAQRARAEALAREAVECWWAGDIQSAGVRYVNAYGEDPGDPAIAEGLVNALDLARATQSAPVSTVAELRSFAAVAHAEELVEHPELLADWARAFGASDDATLVIRSAEGPAVAPRLVEAVERAGLGAGDGPDLAALLEPLPVPQEIELRGALRAVYSRCEPDHDLRSLPRFDGESVGALRELAVHAARAG